MASFKFAASICLVIFALLGETVSTEDCELHRPTIQDFCCDTYEENLEFIDCLSEWTDKLDFPSNRREEMVLNFCIAECTYNETEYLKDHSSMDLKIVESYIEDNYDGKEAKIMTAAFKKCEKHGREMLQHEEVVSLKKRMANAGCRPYAGLVMECVTNYLIVNCPDDKWNDSVQCEHSRDYLKKCVK